MRLPITDPDYAHMLDEQDPLAHFRNQFVIEDDDLIYLDGNSLGRLLKKSTVYAQDLIEQQWGNRLIRSWNEGWIELQAQIGGKIGQLIGADADEVIVADSTSINLFKLALAAVCFNNGRSKIVTDDLNFPSDLYILQGVAALAGRPLHIEVVPSPDGIHGPVDGLAQAIDADTALVTLSHTVFKSSYTYDLTAVTQLANNAGALMLWDMSHSVGSVTADLHAANAPLAVGCTYKYLNGGPGSPAFLYIQREWQSRLGNPITGWMGHSDMFEFALDYQRDAGLRHFLTGTPPILSTALIEPGVDLLLAAGMVAIREKSVKQTNYLIELWREWLEPLGFSLKSPTDIAMRGSHVSLGHVDGWRISQALINDMQVIPDFRKPDIIRFGMTPLYTRFSDIYEAMSRLRQVMDQKEIFMENDKKVAILSKLNRERADLRAFLDGLTADNWQTAVYDEDAKWTLADIVRHLVDAERGMIALMQQWQQGKDPVPPDFDLVRWNARVVQKAAEKSPTELLAEMAQNRVNLLAFIESIQPEDWTKQGRHGSLRIMTIEEVCHLIADHELSHLAVMETAV